MSRSIVVERKQAESSPQSSTRPRPTTDASLLWLAVGFAIAGGLWLAGTTDPGAVSRQLHLEPLFILVALDRFADALRQTNAMTALARRAARATRGDARRSAWVFVGLLMAVGTVNNNLTTAMLVVPAVLVALRAAQASAATTTRTASLVLAAGNVAGAATPTGDFPALILISAGAISYTDYLRVGTPLFLMTAVVLAIMYRRILRSAGTDKASARLGLVLLETSSRHLDVDWRALARLGVVFGAMVVAWIVSDPNVVSPAVIAWAGLAAAAAATRRAETVSVSLSRLDLGLAAKLGGILIGGAALSSTGVFDRAATILTGGTQSPVVLLLVLMVLTTVAAGVADASAAAGLLPLVLNLTQTGNLLAPYRALTVIAYAAAVCAGSSLFTTSATAGQLIEHRVGAAGIVDPATGDRARFTWRTYAPYGALNCLVQLGVAAIYVVVIVSISGAGR